ncbi:glutamine amidotransferase [Cryobacterium tagatosivorans]|uniref:Glutamine amidotransferase n=1 Tax=Cryobacterium tagatosivorans TaxID=1259199 RepID=A0A4V3I6W4_9MICO|nr:glutamine amidotransferase [Cryobacterium tagatosivorans]TFB56680.1 glutamine amidotransferase [Cryobacterium tagatosivorans]
MSRTALVLRHDDTIHLGNLAPVLREHGYDVRHVDTLQDDVRGIDALAADLVVVLGGDMGVNDADRFPALRDEVELLAGRLGAGRPVFGVCLGAQLMASALGSAVYAGPTNEIGFRTVEPTEAGAASPLRHIAGVPVMQWHSDTFDLPEGVTRLAGSPQYGNEAFGIGNWALAVQFHPEVTDEMHEQWLAASAPELLAEGVDADDLRRERARYSAAMQDASRAMFSEWLDGLDPQRTP